MKIEKFLYKSLQGPNAGKWVSLSEKACLNLADQGYEVRKIVVEKAEIVIDENDPWAGSGYD